MNHKLLPGQVYILLWKQQSSDDGICNGLFEAYCSHRSLLGSVLSLGIMLITDPSTLETALLIAAEPGLFHCQLAPVPLLFPQHQTI